MSIKVLYLMESLISLECLFAECRWKTRRTGCTFAVSAEQNRFVSGDQHGGAQKPTRKTG